MEIKKSYKLAGIIALIVAIWILVAIIFPGNGHQEDAENSAYKEKEQELVEVRVVKKKAEETNLDLTILGITKALRTVEIRSQTSGQVKEIYRLKGSQVKQGDLLVRLAIKNRLADLKKAKAALERTKIELEAAQKLSKSGVRALTQVAQARASYEEALASVSAIELDIKNTQISSPVDGVFDKKNVSVGDFVDVAEKVASIVDLSAILVTGSVTEADIPFIKIGTIGKARILGGKEYVGSITYKSAVADPKTRTFEIELRIDNEDRSISQGMTAEMTIPLRKEKAHFVSPAVLTLSDEGKIGVKILDGDNIVRFKPVTILNHSKEGIWLTNLDDEINLIVVGQEFVSDGQKVKPKFFEYDRKAGQNERYN